MYKVSLSLGDPGTPIIWKVSLSIGRKVSLSLGAPGTPIKWKVSLSLGSPGIPITV